jgi:hypothetical protein
LTRARGEAARYADYLQEGDVGEVCYRDHICRSLERSGAIKRKHFNAMYIFGSSDPTSSLHLFHSMADLSYPTLRTRMENKRRYILGHIEKHDHDLHALEHTLEQKIRSGVQISAAVLTTINNRKKTFKATIDKYKDAVDLSAKAALHRRESKRKIKMYAKAERLLNQAWAELTSISFEDIV